MKVLFITNRKNFGASGFIKNDLDLLSRNFKVWKLIKKRNELYGLYLWRMFRAIISYDVCYIWFAGWNAFYATLFCKLLRKKSILIPGGFDVADVPQIQYGYKYSTGWKGRFRLAMRLADAVVPVSEYCRRALQREHGVPGTRVIYNGVNVAEFHCDYPQKSFVLTVAYINKKSIEIKGLEHFLKAASLLPKIKFVLAGDASEETKHWLETIVPSNVHIIDGNNILPLYQKAKVYVQASAVESFGMALVEAMACECIPVVTKRGALPEVAGPEAFYTEHGNPRDLAEKIMKAMGMKSGKIFRKRVIENFSLEKREREIINLITDINAN